MRDYFSLKNWLILWLILVLASGISAVLITARFYNGFKIKTAEAMFYTYPPADTGDNMSGWAWNPSFGWISFNSTDCDADCTGPTCVSDGAPAGCPPVGTSYPDYGVKVDITHEGFTGYAWSSNLGWISFYRRTCGSGINDRGKHCAKDNECENHDCSPSGPGAAGDPPSSPYQSAPNPQRIDTQFIAMYSYDVHNIFGWARILALGDNGWIKFNRDTETTTEPGPQYYVRFDPPTHEFHGWAWNYNIDGTGLGWISFNSSDCNNDGIIYTGLPAGCPSNGTPYFAYRVRGELNTPPEVVNMRAPNWSSTDACGVVGALQAFLRWDFVDDDNDNGSAYKIYVEYAGGPSDGESVIDSGKCIGQGTCAPGDATCLAHPTQCKINLTCLTRGNTCTYPLDNTELHYSQAYRWSVQIWDEHGAGSITYNYDSSKSYTAPQDTDNNDGQRRTFTTYNRKFPLINLTRFIVSPSLGEEILFMATSSRYYTAATPATSYLCDNTKCSWTWRLDHLGDPTYGVIYNSPLPPTASTSRVTFYRDLIGRQVNLTVRDVFGGNDLSGNPYACSTTTTFTLKRKLPSWVETKN